MEKSAEGRFAHGASRLPRTVNHLNWRNGSADLYSKIPVVETETCI